MHAIKPAFTYLPKISCTCAWTDFTDNEFHPTICICLVTCSIGQTLFLVTTVETLCSVDSIQCRLTLCSFEHCLGFLPLHEDLPFLVLWHWPSGFRKLVKSLDNGLKQYQIFLKRWSTFLWFCRHCPNWMTRLWTPAAGKRSCQPCLDLRAGRWQAQFRSSSFIQHHFTNISHWWKKWTRVQVVKISSD